MKIKDKISDELNNFWDEQYEETSVNHEILATTDRYTLSDNIETSKGSFGDQWIKILKGLFLFLPGVVFLFGSAQFMFHAFFTGRFSVFNVLLGLPWLFLWGFMVMFGIGNVKNPKHLYIPFSIVGIAFLTFLVSFLLGDEIGWSFLTSYSLYLFPLVFAVPVLVRDYIGEDPE